MTLLVWALSIAYWIAAWVGMPLLYRRVHGKSLRWRFAPLAHGLLLRGVRRRSWER